MVEEFTSKMSVVGQTARTDKVNDRRIDHCLFP